MRSFNIITLGLSAGLSLCPAQNICTLSLTVIAPRDIPANGRVYVAGNHPAMGNWDPGRVPLARMNDSVWHGEIILPAGFEAEFKITRGSWAAEAMYSRGIIPPNEHINISKDTMIILRVVDWGGAVVRPEGGITGTVQYHHGVAGKGLHYTHDVVVWLPPLYAQSPQRRYPVLYMHDGQNVFDPATSFAGHDWRADEVADSLIRAGSMQEIIIVAISNSPDRMQEYTESLLGRAYARFVVRQVKPMIDSLYRTLPGREHTAVMGSSLGGLISFLIAWWYPDAFADAACLSGTFSPRFSSALESVQSYAGAPKNLKIYIDCGGSGPEATLKEGIDRMFACLTAKGYREGKDLMRVFVPDAPHNEQAWAGRLWRPLLFFFPNDPHAK